mgnify:CR=1 FL=1
MDKRFTLEAISNLLHAERGEVTKGSIEYQGDAIAELNPAALVKRGVIQVMEGRHCFEHLTIEENLLTGAYTRKSAKETAEDLEMVYNYFPRLKERRKSQAGYTSGGEQQMLAIARALARDIKVLLLDEPYEGLAPVIVDEIEKTLRVIKEQGMTTVIVEQNAVRALELADRAVILDTGGIVFDGLASEVLENEELRAEYLAI